ncbi:hypothetical protein BDK51DRAFT_40798 [Blyttiomyces helicus]|uniref:Uncharacterized protein n=1 Tax=Blyttiomyces helicus TaxID=388810 RepID=A0A4P9W8R9_9FUNG|nr:hypothetical protein BDK51DRAFT_40798 [Blyttiomyces helicus]|eukprot:RKO88929.1 hypothetical protein BDK51DRAFT_40798 [Blyttiomyces helicus]
MVFKLAVAALSALCLAGTAIAAPMYGDYNSYGYDSGRPEYDSYGHKGYVVDLGVRAEGTASGYDSYGKGYDSYGKGYDSYGKGYGHDSYGKGYGYDRDFYDKGYDSYGKGYGYDSYGKGYDS